MQPAPFTLTRLNTVARAIAWRCARLWQRREELVLVKNLSNHDVALPATEVETVAITDDHVPQLIDFNARYRDAAAARRLAHYLKCGYQCFLGIREGSIIGYHWWVDESFDMSTTHPHVPRYAIGLEEGDVYCFDYYVAPEYRGGGTATAFFGGIQDRFRRLGYRRMWGVVFRSNVAARWLYSLYNHETVRSVRSYILFSLFLFSEGSVFVKQSRRRSFDYRRLISFTRP